MTTTTQLPLVFERSKERTHRPRRARPHGPIAAALDPAGRSLRVQMAAWALAHGRSVDLDALGVLILAKAGRLEPFREFREETVSSLVLCDAWNVCEHLGVPAPAGLAPTLWVMLDYFADLRLFARGSDRLSVLRLPLQEYGGLDARGRPRLSSSQKRHPANRAGH